VSELKIGYARVSTDAQDLTAQRDALQALGVDAERIYVDHGLTGAHRDRPGLRQALAACRAGDTLVVTKLDRLARSLPDARAIADELTSQQVKLALGTSVHDPTDPVGRLLFNVLAMVAEFEADLIRARTREGMKVAKAKGRLRGKQPKLSPTQEAHLVKLYRAGEHIRWPGGTTSSSAEDPPVASRRASARIRDAAAPPRSGTAGLVVRRLDPDAVRARVADSEYESEHEHDMNGAASTTRAGGCSAGRARINGMIVQRGNALHYRRRRAQRGSEGRGAGAASSSPPSRSRSRGAAHGSRARAPSGAPGRATIAWPRASVGLGLAYPVPQRLLVDAQVTRDLRDRPARLEHEPDRALTQLVSRRRPQPRCELSVSCDRCA
jgi:DNA invertase Pin-like site-specific DNA recombinase